MERRSTIICHIFECDMCKDQYVIDVMDYMPTTDLRNYVQENH